MLLLISTNDLLIEQFSTALTSATFFISLPTVTDTRAYLSAFTNTASPIELIAIDTTEDIQSVVEAYQLSLDGLVNDVPLLAIINDSSQRQTILETGADDYLLLPLITTEIRARINQYLHSTVYGLDIWIEGIHPARKDISSAQTFSQALQETSNIFKASGAWLFLYDLAGQINLVSSYNLPAFLDQDPTILKGEADVCLRIHQQDHLDQVQFIPMINVQSSNLQLNAWSETTNLSLAEAPTSLTNFEYREPAPKQAEDNVPYYLSVALKNNQEIVGVLNLIYLTPSQLLLSEKRMLTRLAQHLGPLLDIFQLQEATQIRTVQNEFMVLIARTINESLELNTILALSLEQIVPLLNAASGDIWLLSADGQCLELVSSLSTVFSFNYKAIRQPKDQGLLGWVMKQNRSLNITGNVIGDSRFDPNVDCLKGVENYSILATPLCYRGTNIGILAVRNSNDKPFTDSDTVLFEGVVELTASAIMNARLIEERERLHHEIVRSERLATIGRLTTSLSHEISNPAQVIQGALSLAKDQLNDPSQLATYIKLSLDELDRMIEFVNRMRQIQPLASDTKTTVNLNNVLQEAINLAKKEMKRKRVELELTLTPVPSITGIPNQLHLMFLNLLLNFSDAIDALGGGRLYLRSIRSPIGIQIEFLADTVIEAISNWVDVFDTSLAKNGIQSGLPNKNIWFSLLFSREVVSAHDGDIRIDQLNDQTVFRIEFPSIPENMSKNIRSIESSRRL